MNCAYSLLVQVTAAYISAIAVNLALLVNLKPEGALRRGVLTGDERSAMKHVVCLHWYATAFVVATPALSDLFLCWQVDIFTTPTEMLAEGEERERAREPGRQRERKRERDRDRDRERERGARERGVRERGM